MKPIRHPTDGHTYDDFVETSLEIDGFGECAWCKKHADLFIFNGRKICMTCVRSMTMECLINDKEIEEVMRDEEERQRRQEGLLNN
jgi:hypothetical protein